jgi:hypothetical protein
MHATQYHSLSDVLFLYWCSPYWYCERCRNTCRAFGGGPIAKQEIEAAYNLGLSVVYYPTPVKFSTSGAVAEVAEYGPVHEWMVAKGFAVQPVGDPTRIQNMAVVGADAGAGAGAGAGSA